jgi:tRNA(Ile)-lysidine synthase
LGVIEQLLNHIDRNKLCKTTDKILLAVSGGIDSMVMLDIFLKAGFSVGVAHCNFQLRGTDSDLDESFVRKRCGSQIRFYTRKLDTSGYADRNKVSIQMAARELRYSFFEEVANSEGFDFIATAHQQNDALETSLMNFVKGTGIDGMTGIPVRSGRIIRPLLFATRKMIREYARANAIVWREDSSNDSDDYQRNFLRHQIVPLMEKMNPNLLETFSNTQERLKGAQEITKSFVLGLRNSSISKNGFDIRKDLLLSTTSPAAILWEMIKEFGFNFESAKEIVTEHQSGKVFHSASFTITVDRDMYLVREKVRQGVEEVHIRSGSAEVSNGSQKILVQEILNQDFKMDSSSAVAQLDSDKVQFPLRWRGWKSGDSFIPLGMRQRKKLSDFFIDLKIPLPEKERITVVESNGVIVWVVGFRIHDDYKITEKTERILVLEQC